MEKVPLSKIYRILHLVLACVVLYAVHPAHG
jgi:hypothetical protein